MALTSVIHSNWANELRVDDRRPETPVVAAELGGTSVTNGGKGPAAFAGRDRILAANHGVRFPTRERGYVRCVFTPAKWVSDYVAAEDVNQSGG